MSRTASGAGAVAAAAFTLPALGFAIGPVFDRQSASWQEIGPLSRFTESDYTTTVITIEPGIGEAGRCYGSEAPRRARWIGSTR